MHSLTRFEVNSYTPIVVRTRTDHLAIAPIAFDCVKLIVVRAGGALLSGEFGNRNVEVGDVIVLAANTLCGAEPEDWITATTLYIDRDYVIDQVFWQHAAQFRDRRDAVDFLDTHYSQPAQVIRIGEDRAGILMPWLDELAALSTDGAPHTGFIACRHCCLPCSMSSYRYWPCPMQVENRSNEQLRFPHARGTDSFDRCVRRPGRRPE